MKNNPIRFAAMLAAVLLPGGICAQTYFYSSGMDGTTLVRINTATGVDTTIGSLGQTQVYGMSFHPNGTLYALVNGYGNAQLATVNTTTGAATVFGASAPVIDMMALDFDAAGNLYTASWIDNNLYSMNPATGVASLIGNLGFSDVMDITFDPSGQLWGASSTDLWQINTVTGAGTHVAGFSIGSVMGIAFDGAGNLYGTTWTNPGQIYVFNPLTGASTLRGTLTTQYPHGGDIQLASVPEPSTCAALIGIAALGIAVWRRKT